MINLTRWPALQAARKLWDDTDEEGFDHQAFDRDLENFRETMIAEHVVQVHTVDRGIYSDEVAEDAAEWDEWE